MSRRVWSVALVSLLVPAAMIITQLARGRDLDGSFALGVVVATVTAAGVIAIRTRA
jgi:hypothetical protein